MTSEFSECNIKKANIKKASCPIIRFTLHFQKQLLQLKLSTVGYYKLKTNKKIVNNYKKNKKKRNELKIKFK